MSKKIKIAVFGFGCVGQGLYNVLQQTKGIEAEIVKICIRDREKKRSLHKSFFTVDKDELLYNEDIDVIVELIDDPVAAFEIVKTALKNGKAVVTANKKMIADNFEELKQLQEQYEVPFLYEGSCCASIPIIRNLEEYYNNDLLSSVEGIFNGSTNYILTKIFEENRSFEESLIEAQAKGFAEADPTLDIKGFDAKYKLCIILAHTFGLIVRPEFIFNLGIDRISAFDVRYAREKGYKIKLVAFCRKSGDSIYAGVFPKFIKEKSSLYNIDNEYNGISLESTFSENQFFSGKGAGSNATGSAVLSDISAITYNYRYEYKKFDQIGNLSFTNDFNIRIYLRYDRSKEVDKDLFVRIDENYHNGRSAYIVGEINLNFLICSGITARPDVNVIVLSTSCEEFINNPETIEEVFVV